MNSDTKQISANVLLTVDNVVMHRLVNKEKSLFSEGVCKLAKIQNSNENTVFFLNINSFYYTLNKEILFAKIPYPDTVSYLFPHFDNGLSAITLLASSDKIHEFEEILKNAARLQEYDKAMEIEQVRQKINYHCPGVDQEPIYVTDKVKKVIEDAGSFLGTAFKTIGGYMSYGVEKAGEFINKKTEEPQQKTEVNPQTKQKWEKLKKGTGDALVFSKQIYSKYLSPVVQKGADLSKDLINKVDQSENTKVIYAKEIATTSGKAIGEAINGLIEGASSVGKQIGDQSRKIVNKKYGEDYVKTFIPEQSEQTQGQSMKVQEQKQENQQVKIEMKEDKQEKKEKEDKQEKQGKQEELVEKDTETKPLYPYLKDNE